MRTIPFTTDASGNAAGVPVHGAVACRIRPYADPNLTPAQRAPILAVAPSFKLNLTPGRYPLQVIPYGRRGREAQVIFQDSGTRTLLDYGLLVEGDRCRQIDVSDAEPNAYYLLESFQEVGEAYEADSPQSSDYEWNVQPITVVQTASPGLLVGGVILPSWTQWVDIYLQLHTLGAPAQVDLWRKSATGFGWAFDRTIFDPNTDTLPIMVSLPASSGVPLYLKCAGANDVDGYIDARVRF